MLHCTKLQAVWAVMLMLGGQWRIVKQISDLFGGSREVN